MVGKVGEHGAEGCETGGNFLFRMVQPYAMSAVDGGGSGLV
jgi:hypothetical protein